MLLDICGVRDSVCVFSCPDTAEMYYMLTTKLVYKLVQVTFDCTPCLRKPDPCIFCHNCQNKPVMNNFWQKRS